MSLTHRIAAAGRGSFPSPSLRKTTEAVRKDYLLSKAEYARLQSNLNDQRYGYKFKSRPNGGKIVAMDNLLVYTDRKGTPEHVLEVDDTDVWAINDIQQDMMLMEERGEDYEMQRIILESVYGEERAHFRTKGERTQTSGENRTGTGRNARSVGKGNSGEISPQKPWGTQDVLNGDRQYALRDTEYLSAVDAGDLDTAQRMVDEAAKEAGYVPVKLYHGTRQFGFTEFNTEKSDDKLSIFVTDNRRIAESYSRENADIRLKDRAKLSKDDLRQKSSAELEPYVQEYVGKHLRAPTERELRKYTAQESASIFACSDWISDYLSNNSETFDDATKTAIARIADYADKLAKIPAANMERETDGYSLRIKFEYAISDLAWENRDAYEAISAIANDVLKSANALINARFSDPFYDERDGALVNKWDVTDRLTEKLFAGIYELYGDRKNLLVIDADDSNWNTIDGGLIGRDGVRVTTRDVASYAKDNGYSGVEIKNLRDGGGMTAYQGASDVLVYFDNTSVKSADPVTYDDAGEVIPLSERFNADKQDIRYARRAQNQLTQKQYESYGWVRENNILSKQAYSSLMSKYSAIKSKTANAHRTPDGYYIVDTGDEFGINKYLVLMKGSIAVPVIEDIYCINLDNETMIDAVRRDLYGELSRTGTLSHRTRESFDQDGLVDLFTRGGSKSYSAYAREYATGRTARSREGAVGADQYGDLRGGHAGEPGVRYARRDDMTTSDVRDIISGMDITDSMNETEKDLLTRYKNHLAEMQRIQGEIDRQQAVIDSDSASAEEKIIAENRKKTLNKQRARENFVIESREDLQQRISEALTDSSIKAALFVGNVDKATRNQLERETGITLFRDLDYAFGISADCIRHIAKHFNNAAEIADAVETTFSMLKDHDSVTPQKRSDGGMNLILKKNAAEIELEAPTWISRRTRSVTVKTAYITKNNKKRANPHQASIVNNRDSLGRVEQLNNSVLQSAESVNGERQFSRRDDMTMADVRDRHGLLRDHTNEAQSAVCVQKRRALPFLQRPLPLKIISSGDTAMTFL